MKSRPATLADHLASNLRQFRNWWKWSQKQLAEHAGLPSSLITRIEKGKANPRLREIQKLAIALKVEAIGLLDPTTPLMNVDEYRRQLFWKHVQRGKSDECWIWIGARDKKSGYGKFALAGKVVYPHRAACAIAAPLAEHWTVDHKCTNRRCVNPAHLDVTPFGRNLHTRDRRIETNKMRSITEALLNRLK